MDWLRQIPIGQYVSSGSGWLRFLDPRVKLLWVLMFLLTPVLASSSWRIALVAALISLTLTSGLPVRMWWRSFVLVVLLAAVLGILSILLPTGDASAVLPVRSPDEISGVNLNTSSWEMFRLGPLRLGFVSFGPIVVVRRSAQLALNTSTLIFTVVHSVNLMLLTTPPEELVWAMSWFLSPLSCLGFPVDRLCFQLLLSLRFLPLVQEEFQNLLRAMASRAVDFRRLGLKASIGLILSVGERLLANILLRAEQGAEAFLARGGFLLNPERFRPRMRMYSESRWLNICSGILLVVVLTLRGKYGALSR